MAINREVKKVDNGAYHLYYYEEFGEHVTHRLDGPAVEFKSGLHNKDHGFWFLEGYRYFTVEEFLEAAQYKMYDEEALTMVKLKYG